MRREHNATHMSEDAMVTPIPLYANPKDSFLKIMNEEEEKEA